MGFPPLKVGVTCSECGDDRTTISGDEQRRCPECGRFAKPRDDYCAKHDVDYSGPHFPQKCLKCEEERRVEAQRQHMMTRDPQGEPY